METDGRNRCFGNGAGLEFYADYHDNEWGVPVHDDRKLFEMLILEGAQAGLSWETILKKRKGYQDAFYNFDPQKVANMSNADLEAQLSNPKIVRNRLKINAARRNARVFLAIQEECGSFDCYLWAFVTNKPIQNHWNSVEELPAFTKESEIISKDLKKRGMTFVGPVIIYAYMQAVGLVNDHPKNCWCYGKTH